MRSASRLSTGLRTGTRRLRRFNVENPAISRFCSAGMNLSPKPHKIPRFPFFLSGLAALVTPEGRTGQASSRNSILHSLKRNKLQKDQDGQIECCLLHGP
jgi:hypothetical protein